MKIVRIRPSRLLFLAVLLLTGALFAPDFFVSAQENPMSAPTFTVEDDEPEAARPQPTLPPAQSSAERFQTVIAPLPPQRPWVRQLPKAEDSKAPESKTPESKTPESEVQDPNIKASEAQAPDAGQGSADQANKGKDEAVPAPAPQSAARPAPAGIPVDAPVPPRRPGPRAPQEAASAPEAPEPPAETLQIPPIAGPERDVPFSIDPDMRVAFAPTIATPSTTAEIEAEEARTPEPTLVEKQTDAVDIACIRPEVMAIIRIAGERFGGTPVITSGQRNRGRRGSFHRKCMAADFFVPGVERATLAKYLRSLPDAGGVGTYCHTKSVHIDIGEPRNWSQCGRRFRFAQR